MKRFLLVFLLAWSLTAQTTIMISRGRTDGGSGIGSFPELDTPLWSADLDEGTGNPAWGGTESSGTMTCSNTTWASTPTALEGNGSNSSCTGSTSMDYDVTASMSFTACASADTPGGNSDYLWTKMSNLTTTTFFFSGTTMGVFLVDTTGTIKQWDASYTFANGYHHIVIAANNCGTLSTCTVTMYIDGVSQTVTPSGTGSGSRRDDSAQTWSIFNRLNDGARPYDGRANKMKIYNFALDADQAAELSSREACGT